MKFGFDDDFNPICLIANGDRETGRAIQMYGSSFEQAIAAGPESDQRSLKLFQKRWMSQKGVLPSRKYAWPKGFCILKGDRTKGLHVYFETNLEVRFQRCPDQSPLAKSEQAARPPEVWTVDVNGREGPSPEREHLSHECVYCMKFVLGVPLAFFGMQCFLKEAVAERRIRDSLHSY